MTNKSIITRINILRKRKIGLQLFEGDNTTIL